MDIDFSSLWSWTIPLWGLFLIVMFLGGVLTEPVVLQGIGATAPVASAPARGGAHAGRENRRVRFSL
jgi:hypothetical protein